MSKNLKAWSYRVIAAVLIIFTSFAIIFTAAYFTPGLSVAIDHCPSAFKSAGIKVTNADNNAAKTIDKTSIEFTESIGQEAKDFSQDPVLRNKQLLDSLLRIAQHDKEEIKTGKTYDRFWTHAVSENCKENMQEDYPINLSTKNVVILLVVSIMLLIAFVLLRKKIFLNHQPLNKRTRVTVLTLVLVPLISLAALAQLTSIEEENPSGKCVQSKAFAPHSQVSFTKSTYFNTLIISKTTFTRSNEGFIANIKKNKIGNETTADQQAKMLEDYKIVRSKYKKLYDEASRDSDFSIFRQNAKNSQECVSAARFRILTSAFFLVSAIGVTIFSFGKRKKSESSIEDL